MKSYQASKGEMALAKSKMNRMFDRGPARLAVIESRSHSTITSYLVKKGCTTRAYTFQSPVREVADWDPDGFIILGRTSEGIRGGLEGHQRLVSYVKETGLPVFGIGLGHQLLAESEGLQVKGKQKRGRKQARLPVKNCLTGKVEIKNREGSYISLTADDQSRVEVTHMNINTNNVEGVQYNRFPGFSVQYMPTSSDYLFNHFIDLVQMPVFKKRETGIRKASGGNLGCFPPAP